MWICVQNGAREHYAIPRALLRSAQLKILFTTLWAAPGLRRFAFGPFRSLMARFHPDLVSAQIVDWKLVTLMREAYSRCGSIVNNGKSGFPYTGFVRDGRWFSETVRDYLARRDPDLRGAVIFSYDTTALELFRWARERGAICVLGQMDPGWVEAELVREEAARWPRWAVRVAEVPGEYYQRREEEWKLANRIIVNSRWSMDALVTQGVPGEKLAVVPLCFEDRRSEMVAGAEGKPLYSISRLSSPSTLRVLWLGQVILRKGIQYLVEAAKLLAGENVRFDIVGPIGISREAMASAPPSVAFHGRVPRDQTADWYRQADVFVLPTISDGFALTQLEAMSHGLPVIATPNCGDVVTDGVDGFIVPIRDPAALANAIGRLSVNRALLQQLSANTLKKVAQFSLDRLYCDLQSVVDAARSKHVKQPEDF